MKTVATNKRVYAHRAAVSAPAGQTVDHLNGNKADDRKQNLQVVSRAENVRRERKRAGKK